MHVHVAKRVDGELFGHHNRLSQQTSQTCIEVIVKSAQTSAALLIAWTIVSVMAGWTSILPTIKTQFFIRLVALLSIGLELSPTDNAHVWTLMGVMIGWTSVLPTIRTQILMWFMILFSMGFEFTSTDGVEGCVVTMLIFWWIRATYDGCCNLFKQFFKEKKAPLWSDPAPYVLGGGSCNPNYYTELGYGYSMTQY